MLNDENKNKKYIIPMNITLSGGELNDKIEKKKQLKNNKKRLKSTRFN
jgi:hypothetical protein